MDNAILELGDTVVTPWKLIGYFGILLFGGRWLVQLIASRVAGRPVVPPLFWYMSMSGNLLLLSYFAFGINDSVGMIANLFPALIAAYNLSLEARSRRTRDALLAVQTRPGFKPEQ
ncbi:MAG TPA: lipid-A-disaccharide synthase N-terminal domain-containing protein [Gammaproteobacteria bacterium]